MSYSNAIRTSHTILAASLVGAATVAMQLSGPEGKTGRVVAISALSTTGVTVAASKVQVGTTADPDGYAYAAVDFGGGVGDVNNVVENGALGNKIAADALFEIGDSGGSTAGVVNYTVAIDWS